MSKSRSIKTLRPVLHLLLGCSLSLSLLSSCYSRQPEAADQELKREQMADEAQPAPELATRKSLQRNERDLSQLSKPAAPVAEAYAGAPPPQGVPLQHQHHDQPADAFVPHNTEDYDLIQENPFLAVTKNPLSTFSIDVDTAAYSNLRRFVSQQHQLPPKDAVRIEELVNYFPYDYPEPRGEHPFSVTTELAACPWQPENKLLRVGLKGKSLDFKQAPPNNLTFLIDVSGSMSPPNRLPLLKRSLKLLVDEMREQDHISMVVYSGASGLVLPPTSGADKATILAALDRLEAGGSTAGSAGLQLAYETARKNFKPRANNRVILASDGDFNVGPSSDAELVRLIEKERQSGIYLTVLGYGMGNYKDNKMEKLAQHGNGNYAYIDNLQEARKVLVTEMGSTLLTIAKDVKLQLEFNPVRVAAYRLIGYENRLLRAEDFDDDSKDAGELGAGTTVTALYEIVPASRPGQGHDLRYQQQQLSAAADSNEILTLKLRYKPPQSESSRLLSHTVKDQPKTWAGVSSDFRFAAAVASLGMQLRGSEHAGRWRLQDVLQQAEAGRGQDPQGYRQDFVALVKQAQLLKQTD